MGKDWRPYLAALAAEVGNDWPEAALERLLILTGKHGLIGAWSEDAAERNEQEERLALHAWALTMIEAGIAAFGDTVLVCPTGGQEITLEEV